MTVGAYGQGSLAGARAETTFRSLKAELGTLQGQLSTGKTASTHAGLGVGAASSLSVRSLLSRLEGYASGVSDAQLRVQVMNTGVEQVDRIARSLASSLPATYNQTAVGQTSAIVSAEDGLKQVLDILNTEVGGRFLFGGRAVDAAPAVSADLILNGDGARAGLRQLVAERKAADLGASGLGRLTLTSTASGVTVGQEAAGLPFGFEIAGASATGSGLTASSSAGPPASATLAVSGQPASGDTVSLTLALPDSGTTTLTLTARSDPGTGANSFAVGATASDTAANLRAAVRSALSAAAGTTLASASTLAASDAFFAGSPSSPPVRVAGPPFDAATATVAGTDQDTVIWYAGDDAPGSARETAPVRTGDGTRVAVGARANEAGFRSVLAALGALAADGFPATDGSAQARYAALADTVAERLDGETGIRAVATDLATAATGLSAASERLAAARKQGEDALSSVEDTDPNKVATELLATQTRLQASYQVTAAVAKLSLVNFL